MSERNDKSPDPEFHVEHNPLGPWASIEDQGLKYAIAKLAGENHAACRDDPKFAKFPDFLDALTVAWFEQKAKVEEEARKYGFAPCQSTAEIQPEHRSKAAILSFTLNGSFVLLGNGCLGSGGSGRYEKIPFRSSGAFSNKHVLSGVRVQGDAKIGSRTFFHPTSQGNFILNTSKTQLLYSTLQQLSSDDELELSEALERHIDNMSQTFRNDMDETLLPRRRGVPVRDPEIPVPDHEAPVELVH